MITVSPNTTQEAVISHSVCFEGSAIINLPSQSPTAPDIPSSGTNYTYDNSAISYGTFTKSSGTNGVFSDCQVITGDTAYKTQPFYITGANSTFNVPASPNRNCHWSIGVLDDDDNAYLLQVLKYCNSASSGSCTSSSGSGASWVMSVLTTTGGLVYTRDVNFNEPFFIQSDGFNLTFHHTQGGTTITDYTMTLPATTTWRFIVNAGFVGNQINYLQVWKGTYQGSIPLTWTVPEGGDLVVTGGTACFSSDVAGLFSICADSEFDDPVCVDINVAELSLSIEGLDCGSCFFTGDTVHFVSNGGQEGTLTVVDEDDNEVGTVVDSLTWIAPDNAVDVTARYTLGEEEVECDFKVIEKIQITNIEGGTIQGLIPGETFQIDTNYPYPQMVWENLDCPNVVTPQGLVTIPNHLNSECFGALDCYIQGRLVDVGDGLCDNIVTGNDALVVPIRIVIQPVYPTPDFGGPTPTKWKEETPDYRVLTTEMEGGCAETYIRNRVPIKRWTIRYAGLLNEGVNDCVDDLGFVNGYDSSFQAAQRLDDFWNLVSGQYAYFTVVDYRTGEVWRNVRFEANMERDHINWRRTQSRDVKMVWRPCCVEVTGNCGHYTVKKPIESPVTPTPPPSLTCRFGDEFTSGVFDESKWERAGDSGPNNILSVQTDGQLQFQFPSAYTSVKYDWIDSVGFYDATGKTAEFDLVDMPLTDDGSFYFAMFLPGQIKYVQVITAMFDVLKLSFESFDGSTVTNVRVPYVPEDMLKIRFKHRTSDNKWVFSTFDGSIWTEQGTLDAWTPNNITFELGAGISSAGAINKIVKIDNFCTDAIARFNGFGSRVWLRPEELSIYEDGEDITVWPDNSGYDRVVTGHQYPNSHTGWEVPNDAPFLEANVLNGYPAARFITDTAPGKLPDQSGLFFQFDFEYVETAIWTAMEMAIVVKTDTTGWPTTGGRFRGSWQLNNYGGSGTAQYNSTTSGYDIVETCGTTTGYSFLTTDSVDNEWGIYQVGSAANDWSAFLNGVLQYHSSTNGVSAGIHYVGMSDGFYEATFSGWIVEFIAWDRKLSDDERDAVTSYLMQKYLL